MRSAFRFFSFSIVFVLFALLPVAGFASDYVLGEGDLIKVTVHENPDLTTSARVSGDGNISFPLLGEVKVAGLSVRDVEKKLTTLLSDGYIVDPQVSVFVDEYRSKRVTILGEVSKPGLYVLNGNATLLEIISNAGGLTQNVGDIIIISHKKLADDAQGNPSKDTESLVVNIKDLMEKGESAANKFVQDGDSIFVSKGGFVYVTGEVQKPGAYKISEGTTVIKAIALAGGLTDMAAPNRTALTRKTGNQEQKIENVDMSFIVQPDDLINVPESYF